MKHFFVSKYYKCIYATDRPLQRNKRQCAGSGFASIVSGCSKLCMILVNYGI